MGSDDRRRSRIGTLLTDEVSFETLQDTTYVRLLHPGFEIVPKGTRSEKAWSWLKRGPKDSSLKSSVQVVSMAKSKSNSHTNTWAWLGKPPVNDEYQFDPSKRWPQGW